MMNWSFSKTYFLLMFTILSSFSCNKTKKPYTNPLNSNSIFKPTHSNLVISRSEYHNKLYGFWLGKCIANWTGLVTEMDKIGNIGEIKTGAFYTRDNWGQKDTPSIWGNGIPSSLSVNIDFVLSDRSEIWDADDDTDI